MSDPLRDPLFPNRPQTPDFWRLSETILMLDGRAQQIDASLKGITDEFVDTDSVDYMAERRVDLLLRAFDMEHLPASVRLMLVSTYMAGLVHGIAFEKAGGHRA